MNASELDESRSATVTTYVSTSPLVLLTKDNTLIPKTQTPSSTPPDPILDPPRPHQRTPPPRPPWTPTDLTPPPSPRKPVPFESQSSSHRSSGSGNSTRPLSDGSVDRNEAIAIPDMSSLVPYAPAPPPPAVALPMGRRRTEQQAQPRIPKRFIEFAVKSEKLTQKNTRHKHTKQARTDVPRQPLNQTLCHTAGDVSEMKRPQQGTRGSVPAAAALSRNPDQRDIAVNVHL
ncbi:uncharacterized protein LOC134780545 [Penaeus indicus]|uniref:uncharacterized protein LOC134780545 n=1 Tax=Penaeus indicus TaxID=29960 RepID=UPI00300DBD80